MVVEISLNCQFIPCYFTTSITNTSILLQLIPINRQNNQLDEIKLLHLYLYPDVIIDRIFIPTRLLDNVCIPSGPEKTMILCRL
jgi:hypothetical protein